MKSIEIIGSDRAAEGKKAVNQVRAAGNVPCVLYGGDENVTFAVPEKSFKKLIYTPEVFIIKLNVDGKEFDAKLQEVQYHPVTDAILHVDFLQISPENPIVMDIPVHIDGTSEGQRMGGRMIVKSRRLQVRALISNLPDRIDIDVTPLIIGEEVRISDMNIEGVEFLEPANNIIVAIRTTRVVVEEEEETAEGVEGAEGEDTPAAEGEDAKAPAAEEKK
jgi:large subunit ribosomal protein L25